MDKHILYGVRVILEKQPVDNPWIDHKWAVHDLLPLTHEAGSGEFPMGYVRLAPMHREHSAEQDGFALYMADTKIDLHHAEAEAYAENMQSSDPAIYVVLRSVDHDADDMDDDEGDAAAEGLADIMLVEVSLSPYTVQDYEDCGEDQIIKMPLTGRMAEFVETFVETYFKPEKFIKRKRDRAMIDEKENRGGDQRIKGPGAKSPGAKSSGNKSPDNKSPGNNSQGLKKHYH